MPPIHPKELKRVRGGGSSYGTFVLVVLVLVVLVVLVLVA